MTLYDSDIMSQLVASVGNIVEAGVKGLLGLADGYIHAESGSDESDEESLPPVSPMRNSNGDDSTKPTPSAPSSVDSSGPSSTSSHDAFAPPDTLVRPIGVPSGWIHLPSTYLDEGDKSGQRTVRSFSVQNVVDADVNVEIASDLGSQLAFWVPDDEKRESISSPVQTRQSHNLLRRCTLATLFNYPISIRQLTSPLAPASSASTSSSISSTSSGSSLLRLNIKSQSCTKMFFAFQPSPQVLNAPLTPDDSTSTPRVLGAEAGLNVSPLSSPASLPSASSSSSAMKQSTTRRAEPINRSFSVHGVISIRATCGSRNQLLNLPFYATVCRSLFTSALIDPVSGLTSRSQQSNGQLTVDFGPDNVVGKEYHRDIMLVNRSECEMVWSTAVVSSEHKDAVWFSLRDLDSENVFGVDTSSQPVPLPALSSRHLRLEMRVKAPVDEFEFDFVISNVHSSGNTVTCRAIGSAQDQSSNQSLNIVSGLSLDFGQISDGVWAKKLITCQNTGSKPLDVKFTASQGHSVAFRLAGVAGDDVDEDIADRPRPSRRATGEELSRVDTKRSSSRAPSIASSDHPPSESSSRGFLDTGLDDSNPSSRSNPPSRPLSRVNSRSSYRYHDDSGDEMEHPISGRDQTPLIQPPAPVEMDERDNSDQIEELTMRPGSEYRIYVLYRPTCDNTSVPDIAGSLRQSSFKVFIDANPSVKASSKLRRVITCSAESCTSLVEISSGTRIDFGEVTVGASTSSTITIKNLSALSARVEIAAISKVLSANRNVIVVPPFESVEEKLEFFPRRINDHYEKQIFVRNLLNRANDRLLEIRSKNVDVYNLTIHSHLYRILTPSGSNFLDFGSVIINSPTVRSVSIQNLTHSPLVLDLSTSQPEDVALYVKLADAPTPVKALATGRYAEDAESGNAPPNGELKERFMETLRAGEKAQSGSKPKAKAKEKSLPKDKDGSKQSIGVAVASALRKGGRGRPVLVSLASTRDLAFADRILQLYGNAVVFKDRHLLGGHEYLDLASGPPVSAHRISPRSKRTQLLDTIELEDSTKLSGQHPKIPKLDFAAGAKAIGLLSKDNKGKSKATERCNGINKVSSPVVTPVQQLRQTREPMSKSPALTAKRKETILDTNAAVDVSKMTIDELLAALEQHEVLRLTVVHTTLEEEEEYVKRHIALRKEVANLISSRKLVPANSISVAAQSTRQLVAVMTPNGSTRPHITAKPKRSDSRIFIRLMEFERSFLSSSTHSEVSDLPVRDLVLRSSCVRSVLEVQQTSINFGQCEKGESKSKTIVIQVRST